MLTVDCYALVDLIKENATNCEDFIDLLKAAFKYDTYFNVSYIEERGGVTIAVFNAEKTKIIDSVFLEGLTRYNIFNMRYDL